MRAKQLFFVLLSLCLLASCTPLSSGADAPVSRTVFAMDTVMELTAYGENAEEALKTAEQEIMRLDRLFRRDDSKSDIYAINTKKEANVSSDTVKIISDALSVSAMTNGSFDISITPLMDLWGFYTKDFYVPSDDEIDDAKQGVDYRKITVSQSTVTVGNNTTLDLGGIAKGYLSDRIMKIWREQGITSGIVSLGGNVETLGTKPDGSPFRIAVENSHNPSEYIGVLSVQDKAVITSGAYQRNFTQDGITYHHILDPETGKSANSGLASVTVVGNCGTIADGLSTALFIMGLKKGIGFWKSYRDFEVIWVTEADEIYITKGLEPYFESEFPIEIVP